MGEEEIIFMDQKADTQKSNRFVLVPRPTLRKIS